MSVTEEEIEPHDKTCCPKDGKVNAESLLPEKEVEQPAKGEDKDPEFVWICFHENS
jgi:hypothetical protein